MRYVKGNGVVERKVRKSRILVPLGSGAARVDALYTLNQMAASIWDLASAGMSDDEIVTRITGEFDVAEDHARRDAVRILGELVAIGALTAVETQR